MAMTGSSHGMSAGCGRHTLSSQLNPSTSSAFVCRRMSSGPSCRTWVQRTSDSPVSAMTIPLATMACRGDLAPPHAAGPADLARENGGVTEMVCVTMSLRVSSFHICAESGCSAFYGLMPIPVYSRRPLPGWRRIAPRRSVYGKRRSNDMFGSQTSIPSPWLADRIALERFMS